MILKLKYVRLIIFPKLIRLKIIICPISVVFPEFRLGSDILQLLRAASVPTQIDSGGRGALLAILVTPRRIRNCGTELERIWFCEGQRLALLSHNP